MSKLKSWLKKHKKLIIILLVVLILLDTFIKVYGVFLFGLTYNKADIIDYYDGKMNAPLADEVESFFPQYAELENGNPIYYYYNDQRWRSPNLFFLFYPSVRCLDIQYTPEEYEKQMLEIREQEDTSTDLRYRSYDDFIFAYISTEKVGLYNIAQCVCYNDENRIIRYLFVYDLLINNDPYDDDDYLLMYDTTGRHAIIDWHID